MRKDIIEGKYIGTVVVNFHVQADDIGLQSPDELNRTINEELSGILEELLQDKFGDAAEVTVTKQESWVADPRDKGGSADGVQKTGQ